MKSEDSPDALLLASFEAIEVCPSAAVTELYCPGSLLFRPLLRCRRKRGRVTPTLLRGATRSSPEESELSELLLSRLGAPDASEQPSSSSVVILSGVEQELSRSDEHAVDGVLEPETDDVNRGIMIVQERVSKQEIEKVKGICN